MFFRLLANLLQATDLFLYPLKTLENWRFSDIFRGYRQKQSLGGVLYKGILRNFAKFTEKHLYL